MPERLQKVLARAGYGSRREIERLIEEGRLQVNGQVARLGDSVVDADEISLNGRRLVIATSSAKPRVLIYHKPEGEVCTRSDPEGRATIFDRLPKLRSSRWVLVGRLDINSSGLLLLTTDGELAHRLMHPSSEIEREYAVRVLGEVSAQQIANLRNGVELEDGPARFVEVRDAGGQGVNHWYKVVLTEGRHREVRRLWESQGVQVSRLIRIRFGPVTLPRLVRSGKWLELEPGSVELLYRTAGMAPAAAPKPPRKSRLRQSGAAKSRRPRARRN